MWLYSLTLLTAHTSLQKDLVLGASLALCTRHCYCAITQELCLSICDISGYAYPSDTAYFLSQIKDLVTLSGLELSLEMWSGGKYMLVYTYTPYVCIGGEIATYFMNTNLFVFSEIIMVLAYQL